MLDRTHQPEIYLPQALDIPKAESVTLSNSMPLYRIVAGEEPVLRLTIVVGAGTRHQGQPFVASALLNMLSEGTALYSSSEIATILDTYGIYYDTSIDRDYAMVTINCLEKFLDQALDILSQVMTSPSFDEQELKTYCLKRKEQLKAEREKPSYIARELFSESLFGPEHPYGKVSHEDQYDFLTQDALREFFGKYYVAGNMFAVTSGMVSDESLCKIERVLSQIPVAEMVQDGGVEQAHSVTGEVFQPREGAMQSSIRIGKRLFTKDHPDFNAMQVVAMVLGGYFSSRIVANLREEKGYTYGAYAAMMNLQWDGYIAIATDVDAQATDDACLEIFKEIELLRTTLVPDEELRMVKNIISGEIMRILDGPFGVADITIEGVQIGCLDNSYLSDFIEEVRTITSEKIRELADKYLDPSTFTTIIVGAKEAKS